MEPTDDKNIVKEVISRDVFHNIKDIEDEIKKIEEDILAVPHKDDPDQETLDFYNQEHEMMSGKEFLETKLAEKQAFLAILKAVK